VDGLLLTRRQRLRGFGEKTGLVAGPSLVFALVVLALGLWVDAIFAAAVGVLLLAGALAVRWWAAALVMMATWPLPSSSRTACSPRMRPPA